MRGLMLVLALAACQSKPSEEWTPPPKDRSTVLQGDSLDAFCREQEREPGWTCDDYENCETVNSVDSTVTCRAKQTPRS